MFFVQSCYISMQKTPGFHQNRIFSNAEKQKIAHAILERYTGSTAKDFQPSILLTNFNYYLEQFEKKVGGVVRSGTAMRVVHCKKRGVSLINFNIGAPTAALIIEVLSIVSPKAVLLLGMCGGLHRTLKIGDFIIPAAAIRGEGVTEHFMPKEVPALPTFKIQKFVSEILVRKGLDYRTGVVHTTDYRFWEFNDSFVKKLYMQRVIAIEMETSAVFVAGFASKVANGALLLVSDLPLQKNGIKMSGKKVFQEYTNLHLEIGIQAMSEVQEAGEQIRHYRW